MAKQLVLEALQGQPHYGYSAKVKSVNTKQFSRVLAHEKRKPL